MPARRLCLGPWCAHGERTGGFYACNRYETAKQDGVVCWQSFSFVAFSLIFKCLSQSWSLKFFGRMCRNITWIDCCSLMRLTSGERWQRTPLRDILIIMNDGQLINLSVWSITSKIWFFFLLLPRKWTKHSWGSGPLMTSIMSPVVHLCWLSLNFANHYAVLSEGTCRSTPNANFACKQK